jgi:pimeloyl-ACP methyl ester carboxylesterase
MGEGHPLVLIHAGVADCRLWNDQFALFAQHYKVIRYDLRGFGKTQSESVSFSYRQDLYDLLKHLGIEKAHVLGLSMGGQIATDFVLEHPEMVTALIPVAAGLSGYQRKPTDDEKSKFEQQCFEEMDKAWEQKDFARLAELEVQMWVDGPMQSTLRVPAAIREKVREMDLLALSHTEDLKGQPLKPPAIGRLAEIRVPTLVIWGDLDTHGVIEACELLSRDIAGASKAVLPSVAHIVNMERPVEFNRIVLGFLSHAH